MEQAEKLMNQHYEFKSKFMKNLEDELLNPSKEEEDEEIDVEVLSCPSIPESEEEKYWDELFEKENQSSSNFFKKTSYSFFQSDKKNTYQMCKCCIDSCQAGGCPVQKMLNKDFCPDHEEKNTKIDTFPYYDDENFISDLAEHKPDSTELVKGLKNDIPLATIFQLCENFESMYTIENTDIPFQRIDYCGSKTNNHLLVNEFMSLILHHEDFDNHFIKLVVNESLPDVYSYTFKYINVDEYYRVMDDNILIAHKEDELYQKQFLNCFLQIWLMRNYIAYFEYELLFNKSNITQLFYSCENGKKITSFVNYQKASEYIQEYGYPYKIMILLTHLMNHYYTKNIYPTMDSLLTYIFYIHELQI